MGLECGGWEKKGTAYKIPIVGTGATLIGCVNFELAFVYDTQGNKGLAVSGDIGTGFSAQLDLPVDELLQAIIGQVISTAQVKKIEGTVYDFEGSYSKTKVHVGLGIEQDLNKPTYIDVTVELAIGGGVYFGYTKIITIGKRK